MSKYAIAIYTDHPEVLFEYRTAARLARISEEFIRRCEREELISSRIMLHGEKGLCCADVYRLKCIRHLHEDMGINLETVGLVLQYRNRIKMLEQRLDEMARHMR
jgi:DNA-binding transcriptional MerR regulator